MLSLTAMNTKHSSDLTGTHTEYSEQVSSIILDAVARNKELCSERYPSQHIFYVIYSSWLNALRTKQPPPMGIPSLKPVIVLIPGVLNEMFDKVAFEKGTTELSLEYGFSYLLLPVNGLRGADHNAEQIHQGLKSYLKTRPDAKFLLFGHSKGGIDCLHFIRNHPNFSRKHICGLSTLASPIMGSDRTAHFLIRMLGQLYEGPLEKIFGNNLRKVNIYADEVQKCLSTSFRKKWFKKNAKDLPKKLFYSSVAFESSLFEGNPGMIITKIIFPSKENNDGIVDTSQAHFPETFPGLNLGIVKANHLIGQDDNAPEAKALIATHLILLKYFKYLD
jgi:hypothetical protein